MDIPVYEVDEEEFDPLMSDTDFLNKMKETYFTNENDETLDRIKTHPGEISNIDKVMKEPYIKIKIKNLYNFKVEPLENYDLEVINEPDPAKLFKEGIDKGFSKFLTEKGTLEWKPCEIIDYDEELKKFIIRWRHDGSLKKVTRLNLMYAIEQEDKFDHRLAAALKNRYRNLYIQSYNGMNQNLKLTICRTAF